MGMGNARVQPKPFLIGKEWTSGNGKTFESINPADGSVAAIVAEAGEADVDAAAKAARGALENSGWRDLAPHKRARLLHKFADLIERDAEHLATLQTQDNGKPISESRMQAAWAAEAFRYYAALCETFESEVIPARGSYFSFTLYDPVGVVAAITPWNSPISLEAQKLAPALAAGNAIILKSSEVAPQVSLEYGRLALEAGFPPGVVNVVTGFGATTGKALVSHSAVDMVTFTGGTASGREIAKIAGARLIPSIMELGGKSPNIVFEDADIDHAVHGASFAIFANAGQSCIAGSRLFVQESIYKDFVERLVAAAEGLYVGEPYDSRSALSALASFGHRDRIESFIALGRNEGAKLLCGGTRPTDDTLAKGAYLRPAVLEVSDNNARVAQEEIFGPVACVIRFKNEDDLVEQANDTVFGLACGIWTRDYKRALRITKRIKAGMAWVNMYRTVGVNVPYGGIKQSGFGRECGRLGLMPYLAEKSVYLSLSESRVPWPP
jgi:betaine-aldehyde dehydrogenase